MSTLLAPPPPVQAPPVFRPGRGQRFTKEVDQSWFGEPEPFGDHPRWSTAEEGEALLARDGYLVFPALYTKAETDRLMDIAIHGGEPDAAYEVKGWCFNKYLPVDYRHDASLLAVADKDPLLEQLDRLLGSDCRCHDVGLWVTGPGRKMPFHVDGRAIELAPDGVVPPEIEVPCYGAVVIAALEDQELAMGPTVVVPGSHRRAPGPRQAPIKARAMQLRRGDAFILRVDTCHASLANTGPRRRYHLHSNWGAYPRPMGSPMTRRDLWDPAVIAAATPRQRRVHGDEPAGANPEGREDRWRRLMGVTPSPA